MDERSPVKGWDATTYVASPDVPPDTRGEYLVCWRRPHAGTAESRRRVFHTYAKADQWRRHLESGERRADSNYADQILVTIHYRPTGTWREIP